jgi:hypothetical protein
MDVQDIKSAIEKAGNEYAKKHMQQPTAIVLRKDVDAALHQSNATAFLFDFVDVTMSRERFMGMDVTLIDEGAEFAIPEPREDTE